MFPFNITNPGIFVEGLLTSQEAQLVSDLAGLSYATGDILYYDGAQLQRLPIGTNGHVLTVSTGLPAWAAGGGGGATDFTDLGDVPSSYASQGGKAVVVTGAEDGLEFVDFPTGTGDVTAGSAFGNDNRIIKSDGTGKGVQSTGITIDDSNNISGAGTLNTHTIPGGTGTLALTSQLHNAVTLAGQNYLTLSGQEITAAQINLTTHVTDLLPFANIANGSALSVLGRGANSSGVMASIAAGTDGFVLRRSGTTLAFGTIATAGIANDAVNNTKLSNMAASTIKGRITASTGDPEDLTATQATSILNVFTDSLKGLAPASGGGTTNFLRADGTWAAPAGGGSGDVVGPASATDNALARFDTTTGELIQNSTVTLGDSDNTLTASSGSILNLSSNVVLQANGSGSVTIGPNPSIFLDASVYIGNNASEGTILSRGNFDLELRTGNATTGSITITDGANGDITVSPHGTGMLVSTKAIEVTYSASSAVYGTEGIYAGDVSSPHFTFSTYSSPIANYFDVRNAQAGNGPELKAVGSDTNINLKLTPKGTGVVQLQNSETAIGLLVTSEASSATPTITGTALRNDYVATALATNCTLAAPSGTANANAVLRYRITSTGTYTVGYNAGLLAGNITRTTSLASGETLTQIYQRVGSTWVCVFDDVTS